MRKHSLRTGGLFVALLALSAAGSTVTEAAQAEPFERITSFVPTTVPPGQGSRPYNTHLYAEPASRRLFTIGLEGFIAAYDLDSLKPVGAGFAGPGNPTAVVPDAGLGSLFAAFNNPLQGGIVIDQMASTATGVVRVGRFSLTSELAGRQVAGMYRLPGTSVMWVVADVSGGGGGSVSITELALPGLDLARATVNWTKALPECPTLAHANPGVPAGLGYVPATSSLYIGCGTARNPVTTDPVVPRGVLRLQLHGAPQSGRTTAGAVQLFPRPGNFSTGSSIFDPLSGRLIMDAHTSAGSAGASVYVFDAVSGRYVGGLAAGKNALNAVGFDAVRGRFYALSIDAAVGLVAGDLRLTPPDQGVTAPSFAFLNKQPADLNTAIAVDPVRHRFFLKYSGQQYLVVEDRHPHSTGRDAPNPDAQTVDVEEVAGITQRAFSGAGQGYGSRHRQIGGVQALALNLTSFDGRVFPLGYGTREVRTAYLERLTVANSEASAAAIGADRDQANTQADLDKTDPSDPRDGTPAPGSTGPIVQWPYVPARCADFGDKPDLQQVEGARTSCIAARHTATAAAESKGAEGAVSSGQSTLAATSYLDNDRGVVTRVTASVRDVSAAAGAIRIGEITATAEAWAKGRRGSTGTRYEPVVRDVVIAGQRMCSNACDRQAVADEINRQFLGRIRADAPVPHREATPGGFQAIVRRSTPDQIEEIVLNEQPADRIEVPTLVLMMSQDGNKPSRTVVEFAAVEAEARYGISVNHGGDGGGGGGGSDDGGFSAGLGGEAGSAEGGGPLFGLDSPLGGGALTAEDLAAGSGLDAGPAGSVGGFLWNGLRALRLMPVWAILLAPVYLSARRWLLLERARLLSGGRS